MKCFIDRKSLLNALDKTVNIIQNKNVIPVLGEIKFEFNKEKQDVTMTSNNLEIMETVIVKAEIDEDWKTTIPAKKLQSIVNKFKKDIVAIEKNDNQVKITNGTAKFNLNVLDAGEFPVIEENTWDKVFDIDASIMRNGFESVSSAVAIDDARKSLTGIHFYIKNSCIEFHGTDGKRLSSIVYDNRIDDTIDIDIIIPMKLVNELKHSINNICKVSINKNQIKVVSDNYTIIGKIIEGNYPNVKQVVPETFKNTIKLDTNTTMNILEMVSLIVTTGDSANIIFDLNGGNIKISTNDAIGTGSDEMTIDNYSGDNINFICSPKYMMDAIKSCNEKEFEMRFNNDSSPIGFYASNKFSIIMPLRKK